MAVSGYRSRIPFQEVRIVKRIWSSIALTLLIGFSLFAADREEIPSKDNDARGDGYVLMAAGALRTGLFTTESVPTLHFGLGGDKALSRSVSIGGEAGYMA